MTMCDNIVFEHKFEKNDFISSAQLLQLNTVYLSTPKRWIVFRCIWQTEGHGSIILLMIGGELRAGLGQGVAALCRSAPLV